MLTGLVGSKSAPGTHPNQNVPIESVLELEFVNVIESLKLDPSGVEVKTALASMGDAIAGIAGKVVARAITRNSFRFMISSMKSMPFLNGTSQKSATNQFKGYRFFRPLPILI